MINYQEYQVREYTDRTEWRQNGQLHREDGPAIEYADGGKSYYHQGKLHRVDGPAREYVTGNKYWYQNGKLHREGGPAVEDANGDKYWYLEGKELTEAEFLKRIEKRFSTKTCEGKVIEIEGQRYVHSSETSNQSCHERVK